MNKTESRMLDLLKELKQKYGVLAVKAEFEAEGSRTDELVMLNEVVFRADMKLIIKIGGCEAVRDLDQCRILGASGIMAPMIETPFAMGKFVSAAKKVYGDEVNDVEWIINAETKTCYENFDAILDKGEGLVDTIIVGRNDLSASMGLTKDQINSEAVFAVTKDFIERAKARGITAGFGGGFLIDAVPFAIRMAPIADKFETRKIVYQATGDEKLLRNGILRALEFETLYLKNKSEFYDRMSKEDIARMKNLSSYLAQN
jgi:hypothetical protein